MSSNSYLSSILSTCMNSNQAEDTSATTSEEPERLAAGMRAAPPVVAAPPVRAAPPVVAAPPVRAAPPVVAAPPVRAQPPAARPAVAWAPAVSSVNGCPPGLEYLTVVDQVVVEQLVEMMEVFTGIETANRYILRNAMGMQIYYAMEMSSESGRQYAGKFRAFTMRITNNAMTEVCRIHRPEEPCCEHSKALIEAPMGTTIGYVQGTDNGFAVFDGAGQPHCIIVSPPDVWTRTGSQTTFPITSVTGGSPIGTVVKHYGGAMKEALTNADTFSVHFPLDLNAQLKAVLVAAVFMIDFRYFEDKHPAETSTAA